MLANNETGFILPVKDLAAKAKEKDIPFHTDAVCATAKVLYNFKDLGVDYLSFSSHKFGGLKGSGGILCRQGSMIKPMILGGPHEAEKRAGTENVVGIASTAFALEVSLHNLEKERVRQAILRENVKKGIKEIYPEVVFTESATQLPQTLNAWFVGLNGTLLLTNLDLVGVSASYGSACASGALEVSKVLKNLKLKIQEAQAALRISFGRSTSEEDGQEFLKRLQMVLGRME